MTTTTPDTVALAVPETHRPSGRVRFVVAFLIGLLLATVAGAGALYAYDQQYIGRVLPGVRVGTVDLSGLEPAVAAERLRDAYASLGEGEIVVKSPRGSTSISYRRYRAAGRMSRRWSPRPWPSVARAIPSSASSPTPAPPSAASP